MYYVKKDLFGCFRIEENEAMTMKQVWRKEEEEKSKTTVASIYARSPFRF